MTQEEIQKGYHDNCKVDTNAPEYLKCPAYYTHDGWMQCAEWMQKQMMDKACEAFCYMCHEHCAIMHLSIKERQEHCADLEIFNDKAMDE